MKNLAKLFLQSKQQSGKVKPRESASTARKVGQMRNTVRQMTGYKKGGTMENPKKQDRRVGKYEKKKTDEQQGRDFIRKLRKKGKSLLQKGQGAAKEIMGKQKGGVASPPARKAPKGLGKLMAARRRTKMSPMQMDRKKEGYRARVEKGGGKVMFADEMDRLKGESKKSQKSRIKKGLKLKAGGLAMRGYGIAKRGH
jgi:hypothetical protein|tara:strand:+ start:86 stop:676 length:591 start_codon:yes stop_codon:yes gene_type:complete